MSNPSSVPYAASIAAIVQYQSCSINAALERLVGRRRSHFGLRAALQFAVNKKQEQDREHGVHSEKSYQREQDVAFGDSRRRALSRAHQAVDHPGLAPEF